MFTISFHIFSILLNVILLSGFLVKDEHPVSFSDFYLIHLFSVLFLFLLSYACTPLDVDVHIFRLILDTSRLVDYLIL